MKKNIKYVFSTLALVFIFLYIILQILVPALGGEYKAVINEINYNSFSGKGTAKSPYLIQSSVDLLKLSELVNKGEEFRNTYFEQTKDLNFESIEYFIPIGEFNSNHYFYGIYDGKGHKIYNLKINRGIANVALFGQLGGTVMNLGIESGEIQGAYSGSIASHAIGNEAKIINCYNKATIKASGRAGGIADNFGKGQIINCWNEGDLEAPKTGGISSYTAGAIYNSYCVQEKIMKENFNGTIRKSSGGYSQSKNELAQKMNNGIKESITAFGLKENSLTEWNGTEESISFKPTEAATKKTTK